MQIRHTENLFQPAKAAELAAELNADPQDDWNYIVKHDPKGTGYSKIAIYEPHGAFVGYL